MYNRIYKRKWDIIMKLGTYKNLNLGKSEPTKVTKEEVDSELTKLLQSKL